MAIVETLITSIGFSVAKALFEGWLKSSLPDGLGEAATVAAGKSLLDFVNKQTGNRITARRAKTQFEEIQTEVADNLLPIVQGHKNLDEGTQQAVIREVGRAIQSYDAKLLFDSNLSPAELAHEFMRKHSGSDLGKGQPLFEKLVKEAATLLVKLGPKLPGFDIEAFTRIIDNQGELLKTIQEIQIELKQIAELNKGEDEKYTDFETDYRNEIAANLNRIDHLGLAAIGNEIQQAPLDVAYVSLKAKTHRKYTEQDTERQFETYESVGIESLLLTSPYILIRGMAGCGKTTLLRWLAVQMAKGNLDDDVLVSWRNKVPFYIRLRDYSDKELPNPENFLGSDAQNVAGKMPEGWVHHHLNEGGRGVILIDGVDELREEKRPDVKTKIASWQRSFPSIPIIVTSRPSEEVKASWLDEEQFEHVEVLSLENERVTEFIQNWHSALATKRPALKDELEKDAENLVTEIKQNKTLQELATTPLLLSAICAIHRHAKRELPANQTDLYEQLINMLLDRDQQRKIPSSLDKETTRYYLQKVALWLVRAESSQGNRDTIITFLNQNSKLDQLINTETIYKTLIERSGIVREPIDNQLDYVHRTLQEYLAAAEIVKVEVNCNELIKNAERDFWEKVIEFAGGISGRANSEFQAQLVKGLMNAGKHLLALEMVRGIITDKSANYISKCAEVAISKLVFEKDIHTISAAGALALPYLGFETNQNGWHLGLRVRVLCDIGNEAYETLLSYTECDKRGVVQALVDYATKAFGEKRIIEDFIQQLDINELHLRTPRSLSELTLIPKLKQLLINKTSAGTSLDLRPLGELKQLRRLELWNFFFGINDLSPLDSLRELQHLELWGVPRITDPEPLGKLQKLQRLIVVDVSNINDLNLFSQLQQLQHLVLRRLFDVKDLSPLSQLQQLQHLELRELSSISDLTSLSQLQELQHLTLYNLPSVDDLNPLTQLQQLQHLELRELSSINDLSFLGELKQLQHLTVGNPSKIDNWDFLSQLENLDSFELVNVLKVHDLDFLKETSMLQNLELMNVSDVEELNRLIQFHQLRNLELQNLSSVNDLSPLGQLGQLKHLVLANSSKITDLNALVQLQQLKRLELRNLSGIKDLSFLGKLQQLQHLVLWDLSSIKDVSSLGQLHQLQHLTLQERSDVSGLEEIVNLPNINFVY